MENEKLTYINSRGERLELGVDSVYHCNISKDVEGISGVTSVIYSTNSIPSAYQNENRGKIKENRQKRTAFFVV